MGSVQTAMSAERISAGNELEPAGCAGAPADRLRITVISTDSVATLASLGAAAGLASKLDGRIDVLAVEVVPHSLPLERPPIPVAVLEWSLLALVSEAQLDVAEVSIRICLSRNRRECLQQMLCPRSVIVLGGKRAWWSEEYKLQRWLKQIGHQVIFVDGVQRERRQSRSVTTDDVNDSL